jgi:hypothetical protein
VLSSLLYTLFTHNPSTIIKFADSTTVVGLVTDNDETAYREEVSDLAVWCQYNNLSLNISKTTELTVDYRKWRAEHAPIHIDVSRALSSSVSTSLRSYHGPNTPTQSCRGHDNASFPSGS